jgi:outer membrane lipopolysaccharide assembly protein LptE/RlpB
MSSILPSGRFHRLAWAAALAALAALAGCGVHYGFSEGAFPSHVRTMAILPFENRTTSPDLQSELFESMRRQLQRRLGVRDASQDRADALVRGTIVSYDVDVPVAISADSRQAVSARRRLQITVDVEILDQTTGKMLWQRKGLRAEGEYGERQEPDGRKQAIDRIVSDIVEGAQSQW